MGAGRCAACLFPYEGVIRKGGPLPLSQSPERATFFRPGGVQLAPVSPYKRGGIGYT